MKAQIKVRRGVEFPFFETEIVVPAFVEIQPEFLVRYNAEFESGFGKTHSIAEVLTLYAVEITITEA